MSDGDTDTATGDGTEPDDGDAGTDALETIAGGAAWVFGGRLTKLGLLFATQVFAARVLGTADYGSFLLGVLVLNVGATVGGLGMKGGIVRKLPAYESDPVAARGVLRTGLGLVLLGGATAGGVAFLAAPALAARVFDDPGLATALRIAAVGVPIAVLRGYSIGVAKASSDARPHVVVNQLLDPVTQFAFVVAFVLAGFGPAGAMLGKVLSLALGTVVAAWMAGRTVPVGLRGPAGWRPREMTAFSVPLMFSGSMSMLVDNTDTFLIGSYLSAGAVGLYETAFQLQNLCMVFFHPIVHLLGPELTRLQQGGHRTEAIRTYQLVTKWATFLTLPFVALLVMFPEVVVRLTFGEAYRGAAPALRVLAAPMLVTAMTGSNGQALVALGHSRIHLAVSVGTAVVNVGLNVLLIPQFGIVGAAAASAVAIVFRDLTFGTVLYAWHDVQPLTRSLLGPLAAVAVVLPVGYAAFLRVATVTPASVAALGVVATAVYAVLVVRFGGVEPADRKLLARLEQKAGVDVEPVRRRLG